MHASIDRTPAPTRLPQLAGLDLQARYQSARIGGDYFDAVALGPHVIFLLTDIAGTRTTAHTIAAAAQDTLYQQAPQLFGATQNNLTDALSSLAHEINRAIITAAGGVCFAPTFLGCFDLPLGVLTYINAGGQPAIFSDSKANRILGNATMPLGLFTHITYEPAIQAFEPRDRLLLVTKGVAQCSPDFLSPDSLSHLFHETTSNTALGLCETALLHADRHRKPPWYRMFRSAERVEDLTAVALLRPAIA